MGPIRRYLRITKYSVLEVRIYLDKPSETPWLLSSRDPVLPRVIEEVRPKVLPKLREENENARKKGGKKRKGIKDVVSQEDFECTIFLTETSTRHSVLTKQKAFSDKPKLKSTGNKLTGWLNSNANPIHVHDDDQPPAILREEVDYEPSLRDIPAASEVNCKRKLTDEDDEALFISSSDEATYLTQRPKRPRRIRDSKPVEQLPAEEEDETQQDNKKKLAMNTQYDGFSIYGRILCLVVKRKGKKAAVATGAPVGGSQMMEQWVSTQANQDAIMDEDDR